MTSQISPLNSPFPSLSTPTTATTPNGESRGAGAFGGVLDAAKAAFLDVSDMQNAATLATEQFALGETDDIVGLMAKVEEGELAFKTMLAIRSKLMAAFDEIRNMPV